MTSYLGRLLAQDCRAFLTTWTGLRGLLGLVEDRPHTIQCPRCRPVSEEGIMTVSLGRGSVGGTHFSNRETASEARLAREFA